MRAADPGAYADRERRVAAGAAAVRGESLSALDPDRSARAAAAARSISAQQISVRPVPQHSANPTVDVLIAGCGTGQHAIETAQRFSGARVLAIDLSLTSLAYAKRKTPRTRCRQHRICAGRHSQARHDRPHLRRHRVLRRAASHGRPVCRVAHAAIGAAAGRLDGGRALQRDRARGHREGAGLHRRARLSVRPPRTSDVAGRRSSRTRAVRRSRTCTRRATSSAPATAATCCSTCRSIA